MITVIVPTYNELKNNFIQQSFPLLSKFIDDVEVIIVDSNSQDGTQELAKQYGFKLIQVETNSRAVRINKGIKAASGDMILLHHPRSLLEEKAIESLKRNENLAWGAFTHKFNLKHPLLDFTSFYSNYGRGKRGIFYLDHCIFAQKDLLLKVGLVPEVDIFEDTELCLRLRKLAKPKLLPEISLTSAVRFKKNGIFKQALFNQWLKIRYYFFFNHLEMNNQYENKLNLNSKYNKDENGN